MTELCQRIKSEQSKTDDSGVKMLYGPANENLDSFADVVNEISALLYKEALYLMVNILPPGIVVPVHTDTLPRPIQRWHLAVQTNKDAFFWDEVDGMRNIYLGQWQRIYPERRHTILNFGKEDRIHIVVDLEP